MRYKLQRTLRKFKYDILCSTLGIICLFSGAAVGCRIVRLGVLLPQPVQPPLQLHPLHLGECSEQSQVTLDDRYGMLRLDIFNATKYFCTIL